MLLIGDMNSYAQEDPIFDLVGNGFVDQIGRYNGFGYSYVVDGGAGRLDHAITTPSLSPKVLGALEWHINADEPSHIDYNLEFKQPACATCEPDAYAASMFRASDHDPVVVGLSLTHTIDGSAARDTLVGTPGDDVITGGAGPGRLTGGAGNDVFVYRSMADATDTVTDFIPGTDRIDLSGLLASIGQSAANAFSSGVVRLLCFRSTRAAVPARPWRAPCRPCSASARRSWCQPANWACSEPRQFQTSQERIMMKTAFRRALVAGLLASGAWAAQAATHGYVFSGTLDSGAYANETFSGNFSFDDATLSGVGLELLSLDALQIVFHGQTYTLGDAAVVPDVAFTDGSFLGLEYTYDAALPSFSLVAGLLDATDAFLAYDTAVIGGSGAGSVGYVAAAVPEVPALWLAVVGFTALGLRRRAGC